MPSKSSRKRGLHGTAVRFPRASNFLYDFIFLTVQIYTTAKDPQIQVKHIGHYPISLMLSSLLADLKELKNSKPVV